MLKRFPPYSGMRLSINVTFAPKSTRRRARFDPIRPTPPVMRTLAPEKVDPVMSKSRRFATYHQDSDLDFLSRINPENSKLAAGLRQGPVPSVKEASTR